MVSHWFMFVKNRSVVNGLGDDNIGDELVTTTSNTAFFFNIFGLLYFLSDG